MSLERIPFFIPATTSDWFTKFMVTSFLSSSEPATTTLSLSSSSSTTNAVVGNEKSSAPPKESAANESSEVDLVGVAVELLLNIGIALVSSMLLTMLIRRTLKGVLPQSDDSTTSAQQERSVYTRLARIRQTLGHDGPPPSLSPREVQMADEILDPAEIECSFADIGGLDAVKQELYELAVLPLVRPDLFAFSKLVQPVKGILLYGQPGTGKTMLAKSLAKESEAIFLPLQLSKILNKYWGESNKLIAATFSLAHKIQPAVIFIDELDTFLKNSNSETAYMDSIKAEFLTLWDGVSTVSTSRVLVLGATNKPQHIDPAILRRMPRAFEVPLPNKDGRLSILQLLLKDENVQDSVRESLPKLAEATNGYSGSDLKELCRAAAMIPVQERTSEFARRRVMGEGDAEAGSDELQPIRSITEMDLLVGLQKVRRTGEAAHRYGRRQEEQQEQTKGTPGIDLRSLQKFAAVLQALSAHVEEKDDGDDDIPQV
jgi:ATPase family AAA domain-containing protein 1